MQPLVVANVLSGIKSNKAFWSQSAEVFTSMNNWEAVLVTIFFADQCVALTQRLNVSHLVCRSLVLVLYHTVFLSGFFSTGRRRSRKWGIILFSHSCYVCFVLRNISQISNVISRSVYTGFANLSKHKT